MAREIVLDANVIVARRLNFNDALLVVLQQTSLIGDVASFDAGFDVIAELRLIA